MFHDVHVICDLSPLPQLSLPSLSFSTAYLKWKGSVEIAAMNMQLFFLQANEYPMHVWSLYSITQPLKQYPHTSLHLYEALIGHFERIVCCAPWSPRRKAAGLLQEAHVKSAICIKWHYFRENLIWKEEKKIPHTALFLKRRSPGGRKLSPECNLQNRNFLSLGWEWEIWFIFFPPTVKCLFPLVFPQNSAVHPEQLKMRLIYLQHFNK